MTDYTKIKLRPCVLEAAVAMELKLRKHDSKRGVRGWRVDPPINLLKRVAQELTEAFGEVVDSFEHKGLAAECIDIMNMAMMARDASLHQNGLDVQDRSGVWEEPVRLKRGEQ